MPLLEHGAPIPVMLGLDPGIHGFLDSPVKPWNDKHVTLLMFFYYVSIKRLTNDRAERHNKDIQKKCFF